MNVNNKLYSPNELKTVLDNYLHGEEVPEDLKSVLDQFLDVVERESAQYAVEKTKNLIQTADKKIKELKRLYVNKGGMPCKS